MRRSDRKSCPGSNPRACGRALRVLGEPGPLNTRRARSVRKTPRARRHVTRVSVRKTRTRLLSPCFSTPLATLARVTRCAYFFGNQSGTLTSLGASVPQRDQICPWSVASDLTPLVCRARRTDAQETPWRFAASFTTGTKAGPFSSRAKRNSSALQSRSILDLLFISVSRVEWWNGRPGQDLPGGA